MLDASHARFEKRSYDLASLSKNTIRIIRIKARGVDTTLTIFARVIFNVAICVWAPRVCAKLQI